MNRSVTLLLITVALAGYGIYAASFVPGLLAGPIIPVLLIAFILEAVFGIAGAFGAWLGTRWAAGAVILLGVIIAGTWIFEAFILGIVAGLHALTVAAVGLVAALVVAAYLDRQGASVKA